jgi:hypothetical protein
VPFGIVEAELDAVLEAQDSFHGVSGDEAARPHRTPTSLLLIGGVKRRVR